MNILPSNQLLELSKPINPAMEQLVMECCTLPRTHQGWLWNESTDPMPHGSSFVIVNNVICAATILDTDTVWSCGKVTSSTTLVVKKCALPPATLRALQVCLSRRTNDTFPVRLHRAGYVAEAPSMFVQSQNADFIVLQQAWWH